MVQTYSDNKFIYSVDMMFVFLHHHRYRVKKIKVKDLIDQLFYPGWGDPRKNIKYSPLKVIKFPRKYADDYRRIIKADLNYPIILDPDYNVVDGVHRLSKAYLQNKKYIKTYVFNKNLMRKFIIAKKGQWKKVDNMKFYQLMDLYLDNFI